MSESEKQKPDDSSGDQFEEVSRRKFGKLLGLGGAGAGMLMFSGNAAAATTIDPNYLSMDDGGDVRFGNNDEFELRYNNSQGRLELVHDSGQVIWYVDEADNSNLTLANQDLDMGTNNITNVGNVDGVNVANHSSRHESGGSDEITHNNLNIGTDDHHAQDHASRHSDGGADEVKVENLATSGASGYVPTAQSSGGLSMQEVGGATYNRFVEHQGAGYTQFFMDSSQTNLIRQVQLNGSVSGSNFVDVLAPSFKSVASQFPSPSSSPRGIDVDSNDCIWVAEDFETSFYQLDQSGNIQGGFQAPEYDPFGVGIDSNDCIWGCSYADASIYQLDQSGNKQTGFNSPNSQPEDVAVDSNSCIWNADSGANSIYQLDQSGSVISKFASPNSEPVGLGVDSNDCVWNTDQSADSIYQLDQSGNIITQFDAFGDYPHGVGFDSNESIFHVVGFNYDSIYRLNQQGDKTDKKVVESQLAAFASPGGGPQGVGVDSSDCIWNADTSADSIYRLNQSGSVVTQFDSPSGGPTGVGVDSNDCIWHADTQASSIYKLNQSGSVVTGFAPPSGGPRGVGVDSNDCIWNADGSPDSIYQLDQQGNTYPYSSSVFESKVAGRSSNSIVVNNDLQGYDACLTRTDSSVEKAKLKFST